jgi:hypothetical protein
MYGTFGTTKVRESLISFPERDAFFRMADENHPPEAGSRGRYSENVVPRLDSWTHGSLARSKVETVSQ